MACGGNCGGNCGGECAKVGKDLGGAKMWLDGKYLNFSNGDVLLAPELWLDFRNWLDAWLQVEYTGSGGNYLTVTLQTAVSLTMEETAWKNVTDASTTMTNATEVIEATSRLVLPPMGVLRLKFTASGAVDGTVRVLVRGKFAA